MTAAGIDPDLTYGLLAEINRRENSGDAGVSGGGTDRSARRLSIPAVDGRRIFDRRKKTELVLPAGQFDAACGELGIPRELSGRAERRGKECLLDEALLSEIGLFLLPLLAYGVLNGGSASTYVDVKKNRDLNPRLFEVMTPHFDFLAPNYRGRAKGITPAFINPDGSPGPSFLELKMRNLLLLKRRYRSRLPGAAGQKAPDPGKDGDLLPFFQMTSILNDREISRAYEGYRTSPLLALAGSAKEDSAGVTGVLTGVQPLIAAFTHKDDGLPRRIFTRAWGREDELLPFPGGHGQNFLILKDIYRDLLARGKRFVYLGNVDNLGNTPDLPGLAILALTGKQGAFDFSFKTAVDVKGGILLEKDDGRLDCADIGAAVPRDWVEEQEARGAGILFNCATGLFSLTWLADNLDRIIAGLPLRLSEHHKDPGKYAQTEQITWEVLAMMDDILIFGVDKYRRFLASKLLLENLMLSGLELDNPGYPGRDPGETRDGGGEGRGFYALSQNLHRGLNFLLENEYRLALRDNRWVPGDGNGKGVL